MSHSEFRLQRQLLLFAVLSHACASMFPVCVGYECLGVGGHSSSAAVYLVVIAVTNLFGLARHRVILSSLPALCLGFYVAPRAQAHVPMLA